MGRLWILQDEAWVLPGGGISLQSEDFCPPVSLTFPPGPPEPQAALQDLISVFYQQAGRKSQRATGGD